MSLSTVKIYIFSDGTRLVKDRLSGGPEFRLIAFIDCQWQTIKQWNDAGHVANLLVKSGLGSEHSAAISLLNAL